MTTVDVLTALLIVAATAACVAVIWLSREMAATARSMQQLTDDVRERLIPLLEKADVTVDAANAELLRIDGAITRFEDAGARVSAVSNTLADVVQAPADIVTGVADRVRKAWKDRRQSDSAPSSGADEVVADLDLGGDAAADSGTIDFESAEPAPGDLEPEFGQREESTGAEDVGADSRPSEDD